MNTLVDGMTEEQAVALVEIMFKNQIDGLPESFLAQPQYVRVIHLEHMRKCVAIMERILDD